MDTIRHRTQAHILVCFLALALWRTLQQWTEGSGLGSAPRKLLEEMAQVRSMDVVLPTGSAPVENLAQATITRSEIRPRTVSRPEPHLAILLERLDLPLPNRAKKIQNVAATLGSGIAKPEGLKIFRI